MNARGTQFVAAIAACASALFVSACSASTTEPAAPATEEPAAQAVQASPSATPQPATFTGKGVIGFVSDAWVIGRPTDHPAGGMCMFLGDIPEGGQPHEWTQVLVRDGADKIVAKGELTEPIYSESEEKQCWRGFSIDDLAEGELYSLEVGPYTSDVLSDDELAAGITWQLNG